MSVCTTRLQKYLITPILLIGFSYSNLLANEGGVLPSRFKNRVIVGGTVDKNKSKKITPVNQPKTKKPKPIKT